jgi:outer membrane lipoprotein SlyB
MLKKLTFAGAAFAMGVTAIIPATPAAAQGYYQGRDSYGYDRYDERRSYRGSDRKYRGYRAAERCRRDDGTTGAVVGAIAGGLIGNGVAGRGDRTAGTLVGGVLGALAGREVERSNRPGYCR